MMDWPSILLVEKSKTIYMMGHLHLDICEQDKLIVNNADACLKLVLKKQEFFLMNVDKNKYKYKIEIDNAVFDAH